MRRIAIALSALILTAVFVLYAANIGLAKLLESPAGSTQETHANFP